MAIFRTVVTSLVKSGEDLTLRQLAILMEVAKAKKPPTIRSLASAYNLHKPTITRNLHVLASHDLIVRQDDPEDRRSVLVAITDKGRAFAARMC